MDYPDPDEEFDLMHEDEFELLREQEEAVGLVESSPRPANSKRNVNFASESQPVVVQENIALSQNTATQQVNSFETDFLPVSEAASLSSRKRTAADIFGEIDDISDEELDHAIKKSKYDGLYMSEDLGNKKAENEDELFMIEQILELRRLAKERQHSVIVVSKDSTTLRREHNTHNLSYEVPKYSFVAVTRHDGKRVYVRCHSERYEKEEIEKIQKNGFVGVLGHSFKEIWKEAERLVNQGLATQQTPAVNLEPSTENNVHMWVDIYKPRRYLDLLSDESTNRKLLQWLKMWDKVVFKRQIRVKTTNVNQNLPHEFNMDFDAIGRPQYKVALLCGPPGLGKTTLAHMVAKTAGYNVVEVNASDDRSKEQFKTILERATQMQSVFQENRPNCIVFDEIDGAPGSSIEFLVKFIAGAADKKKKKQQPNVLKRPLICICNDVYVPALRPLRQIAFVVNFTPIASSCLARRLSTIAQLQKLDTNLSALLALCEKTGNDIRACLSVLHFLKSLGEPLTLTQVSKASVGQKDMQKGLFSVWNDIFQIKQSKNGQENLNAKSRMANVLQVVQAFGDYDRLAQGVFENYVNVKNVDLADICNAQEWFCYSDILNKKVYQIQNYSLCSYLPYAFVIWHFVFACRSWIKLAYPSSEYEARTKSTKNSAILAEVLKGMRPSVRAFAYSSGLLMDTLPLLSQIIVPTFRPVSLHLYTQQEKEQLHNVVSTMIDYNLCYVQERTQEGSYVYNMDPNIEDVVLFPGSKPKRPLSYTNKQLIVQEMEVEKMRRMDVHKVKETEGKTDKEKDKNDAKVPNHLQKLEAKVVKQVVAKDIFGRVITKPSAKGRSAPEFSNDIWFRFKEGYSNAVRKKIKVSSLL